MAGAGGQQIASLILAQVLSINEELYYNFPLNNLNNKILTALSEFQFHFKLCLRNRIWLRNSVGELLTSCHRK